MNYLTISILLIIVNICNGLLTLPFKNVQPTYQSGDRITVPVSNNKFIISSCAALGSIYLYKDDTKELTSYLPIAYFSSPTELDLFIPLVNEVNINQKYFILLELPLANAVIKTSPFSINGGYEPVVSSTDACGKTVKTSANSIGGIGSTTNNTMGNTNETNIGNNGNTMGNTPGSVPGSSTTNSDSINGNTNMNANSTEANGNGSLNSNGSTNALDSNNGDNNKVSSNNSNILSAESVAANKESEDEHSSNNIVIIACAGTSVIALVVIGGVVFMRGRSYMKRTEDNISYNNLEYNNFNTYSPSNSSANTYSPKTYPIVAGIYNGGITDKSQVNDYQIKCLDDNHSINSHYPVSLSDGASTKNEMYFDQNDEPEVPDVPEIPSSLPPITKHIVEEVIINPEKITAETMQSGPVSAVVTTASFALANLNIDTKTISTCSKDGCSTCLSSSSSGSCSCSCSCSGSSCSCSCTSCSYSESNSNVTDSMKLHDFSSKKPLDSILLPKINVLGGNTDSVSSDDRGYSMYVDNRQSNYSEYTNDDSKRMTNYTETTTDYDNSKRMTNYTEYTEATTDYTTDRDSRRLTNFTEATTDYTTDRDSRRMTNYTEYTEASSYTTDRDSRRLTNFTEATTDYTTDRDSRRLTNFTEATDYTTDRDSRRMTNYTEYTEASSYTTDRDSRRMTNYSEYTNDNRDSRYTEDSRRYSSSSSVSSCSCSDSDCDDSRRNTNYSEYTEATTDYTTDRDSRRLTNYSEYTTDSHRMTFNTDGMSSVRESQYSDFCEVHEDSIDETDVSKNDILPISTIAPVAPGENMDNGSFLNLLQAKQDAIRNSISNLLPNAPIEGCPPSFELEFVARKEYNPTQPGELQIKMMDVVRILESINGGCYMASNSTTGQTGKIPAYIISSLL